MLEAGGPPAVPVKSSSGAAKVTTKRAATGLRYRTALASEPVASFSNVIQSTCLILLLAFEEHNMRRRQFSSNTIILKEKANPNAKNLDDHRSVYTISNFVGA